MTKQLSEGQRVYEAKRAAKAGMSLEKWLAAKEKVASGRSRPAESRRTRCAGEAAGVFWPVARQGAEAALVVRS